MMYRSLRQSRFLFTGLLFACCTASAASRTVLDYYLILPAKYLKALDRSKDRLSLITLKDVQNGYLELSGNWDGDAHVVLWKSSTGQDLLGVSQTDCGPVCHQTLWFLTFKAGKWTDVTAKTFSPLSVKTMLGYYSRIKTKADQNLTTADELPFLYMLPRYQTAIEVVVDPSFTHRQMTLTTLRFDQKTLRFVDTLGVKR